MAFFAVLLQIIVLSYALVVVPSIIVNLSSRLRKQELHPGYPSSIPPDSHLNYIVLRLGRFHTFMNLLLNDCDGNLVADIMTGKSVQRAFRGNFLVDNGYVSLSAMTYDYLEVMRWFHDQKDIYIYIVKRTV